MSDLLEFGGKADVILRAICDFTVNDISYKKDDIMFIFNQVNLSFTYNETIKDKTVGGNNFIAYDERKLNAMLIEDVVLTENFIKLFAQKTADSFIKPIIENNVNVLNNIFYPIEKPEGTSAFIVGYGTRQFIYDDKLNQMTIVPLANEEIQYTTIIYDTLINRPKYDINNNYTLPYFKIQITGIGNINKNTSYAYIEIPRASLLTKPEYSMDTTITAQNLAFKIINQNRNDKIELGVY